MTTATVHPSAWSNFWRTVVRFQTSKMTPWLALRNSLGVGLPLAVSVAAGAVPAGIAMATGALNVSFSDSHEPYPQRVRRMLAASMLVGAAVCAGELSGHDLRVAVAVAGAWAFAAGMLVSLSTAAADLGTICLVTMLVYAAVPQSWERAAFSGLLAFGGGVLQTVLAVAFWPVRRYVPERRALAALYAELARAAPAPADAAEAPPASAESTEAHRALAARARDHSIESERYRLLLSQAERMRLSLVALASLAARAVREHLDGACRARLDRSRTVAGALLASIGRALDNGRPEGLSSEPLRELQELAEALRDDAAAAGPSAAFVLRDARAQLDALAGQLRSALDLAGYATPEGADAFVRREERIPWRLRLSGTVATLRANLSLKSAACRHAVRLAACVALAEAGGRGFALQRSYWLPMTVAIVLKPDFTATFSRGVLRLGGTFLGLVFSTGLFHVLPAARGVQVAVIFTMMFVLRWAGPANYGILVMAVTALVVYLIGLAGVAPGEVMAARGLNTALGGAISLTAYWLWPTWERTQVPEAIARSLDAYRDYFRAVQLSYAGLHPEDGGEIDRARNEGRLARSNVEASIDRLTAEPNTPSTTISLLTGILANARRLAHAMMALEAGLATSHPVPARAGFRPFANAVELTLYSLAAALRGSPLRQSELPDLREAHHALVHSGDALTERYALVNVETDRITNSLNTLSEEILRLLEAGRSTRTATALARDTG